MTKLIAGTVFALVLATGCKKKEDNVAATQTGTQAASGKEGAAPMAGAPTDPGSPKDPGAPSGAAVTGTGTPTGTTQAVGATQAPAKDQYKPDELWTEASAMGVMDRSEKYPKGVNLTGTVKSIKDDPTGEYVVTFEATSGNTVDAMIMDPSGAKKAKLKAGDTVMLKNCSIANTQGTSMPLRNCEYAK